MVRARSRTGCSARIAGCTLRRVPDAVGDAAAIARIIFDYRAGEIATPTESHVLTWAEQFPKSARASLLAELRHLLDSTYYSREDVIGFLREVVRAPKLVGPEPETFWAGVDLLNIQQDGESQSDMLDLLDEVLQEEVGLSLRDCKGTSGRYIYLDDVLFTGSRVGNDLAAWLDDCPSTARVDVIVVALHTLGKWQCGKRLKEHAANLGKDVTFTFWRSRELESRKAERDRSDILWPTVLPDNPAVQQYVAGPHKYPFAPRAPGGKSQVFSSEEGRHVLEQHMLVAGSEIRAQYVTVSPNLRPLGFSPFGLGFGAVVFTYRNCPNNAPLPFWWDLRNGLAGSGWYPLLPRRTYG